jgi:rSAM/selenodomain-associated transferase 2
VRADLSVIIPTLNEAATLPALLADLAAQRGLQCEVLVSDGGSVDGTCDLAAAALAGPGFSGRVLTGAPGRGRQLNFGAAQATGGWLLFLHADSRLPDPTALAAALAVLDDAGLPRLAGHFALRFALAEGERTFGYYFAEVKARSGLPGTIHGDQGFLLRAAFFRELGGFREDLAVMEDTLLAEAVRARGEWRLLPAEIVTSPRRFQVEGFRPRQTLNALMMNFVAIGWELPLQRAPQLYRAQDRAAPLQLAPFFRLVDQLLAERPWSERLRIWYRTGGYVRANAWQLALSRHARRAWRNDLPPASLPLAPVLRFRRRFDLATAHPPGNALAALLTWLWFRRSCRTIPGGT